MLSCLAVFNLILLEKSSPNAQIFHLLRVKLLFDGGVGFNQRRDVLAYWKITVYISCLVLHNQL